MSSVNMGLGFAVVCCGSEEFHDQLTAGTREGLCHGVGQYLIGCFGCLVTYMIALSFV